MICKDSIMIFPSALRLCASHLCFASALRLCTSPLRFACALRLRIEDKHCSRDTAVWRKFPPFITTHELSQYDSPVRVWVTVFLHYAEVTHVRGSLWYNDGGALVHRVEAWIVGHLWVTLSTCEWVTLRDGKASAQCRLHGCYCFLHSVECFPCSAQYVRSLCVRCFKSGINFRHTKKKILGNSLWFPRAVVGIHCCKQG